MDSSKQKLIKRRITVLAYGEGDDEKIFLRHLVASYCRRDKVSVSTSSASGGNPDYILERALRYRGEEKHTVEFILLDTDEPWSKEMIELAEKEAIELIGNTPCLEALFLEILNIEFPNEIGTGRCKSLFETACVAHNFDESECERLFPKSVLKEARRRIPKLDKIIRKIEGNLS